MTRLEAALRQLQVAATRLERAVENHGENHKKNLKLINQYKALEQVNAQAEKKILLLTTANADLKKETLLLADDLQKVISSIEHSLKTKANDAAR